MSPRSGTFNPHFVCACLAGGRKRWRSFGGGDGASEDEGADFSFGKAGEGGELTEGQAEPLPKFLGEPDPLPGVQPAGIAGAEHLPAHIPADFPGLEVFHRHARCSAIRESIISSLLRGLDRNTRKRLCVP